MYKIDDKIRDERLKYPIKQKIPKENIEKIDKLLSKVDNSVLANINFNKTMANLIFSANNPFQEGQPFVSSENVKAAIMDMYTRDFAY